MMCHPLPDSHTEWYLKFKDLTIEKNHWSNYLIGFKNHKKKIKQTCMINQQGV